MDTFEPPRWIAGYKRSAHWPLHWERGVLDRVLADKELCGLLDKLWVQYCDCDNQIAPMLLEECLEMRWQWEELPRISKADREKVATRIRSKALELASLMEEQVDALRAYHAPPLCLAGLFPEHSGGQQEPPEILALEVSDVLRRLGERLSCPTSYEGATELPDRPLHENAYRTTTVERLNKFFWDHIGKPDYVWVAKITNLIVNDPDNQIDANHVAKLDHERL